MALNVSEGVFKSCLPTLEYGVSWAAAREGVSSDPRTAQGVHDAVQWLGQFVRCMNPYKREADLTRRRQIHI